ncbi:membrane protein [Gordoniibacillus kamchatkensis]|uniref:Membrane protein n=1 Tax=Gordoniibacillus kamchatkensis TaxID=1590651 RepID=A0ABR5AD55_9BACL|nr:membrane protein [Paenibacillus sp. VKM B-2647]
MLCLISMIGASLVQTAGGKVTIKDLRWETPSGHLMSALLFIPPNATKNSPAPGIVTSHGWYNNREMQDMNYVEYARRGYVVMSIDMYGHGDSDAVAPAEWQNRGTGMYDAVELMSGLPYVDKARIGITGHSNGARAANWSIDADNLKDKPLISAVLLVANDATYVNPETKQYYNKYGNRNVGIVAAQYDEFFFRTKLKDGTITMPRDYIKTDNAQSFLNFGADPKSGGEPRTSYTVYKQEVNGKMASRVIYNPAQNHPWNTFSASVASNSIDFFQLTLGAPNPIPSGNQIWQWKEFFNLLGLIGFAMFIVSFTKAMLNTAAFASLKAPKEAVIGPAPAGVGKLWFWGGLLVSALISGFSYMKLFNWSNQIRPAFFPQAPVFYIGIWCVVTGLTSIIIMYLSYKLFAKGQGMDLRETGVAISFKTLCKTVGLSLIVTVASFALVFIADYFFKTDFRIWVLAVKAFTPDKIVISLKYLPFFLVFYVANSVAINAFNYTGKKEWTNTALLALFNAISGIIILVIHYTAFFSTGQAYFTSVSNIVEIWLYPIVVILPVAAIISRKIYRVTRNPYLAGIINALIITVISCTNTLTQY